MPAQVTMAIFFFFEERQEERERDGERGKAPGGSPPLFPLSTLEKLITLELQFHVRALALVRALSLVVFLASWTV